MGSARWATVRELRQAGMLSSDSGIILGRVVDHTSFAATAAAVLWGRSTAKEACERFRYIFKRRRYHLVRSNRAVHTAIFAPSGVGKGVSICIPFLRGCSDSAVVLDPKGELAKATAEYRKRVFGHDVVLLDPFCVATKSPDCLNPLDFIEADSALALDECNDLAKALVVRGDEEKEPHWNDSAEAWISAFIAVVIRYGEDHGTRSLQTVRELLSDPKRLDLAIKLMQESDAWGGMLRRSGGQLLHFVDREKSSTLSTVLRQLRFLDTPTVEASTRHSSFDPRKLRSGKMTIYLVLPPEHSKALSALQRMWISSLLRSVVKQGLCDEQTVHFVLDEASSLGRLEVLDEAIDKYRAYGIKLQFYFQSLGQLAACFPNGRDQTLLSNTTQIYFGCNDTATAEMISNRLGDATVLLESGGTSTGTSRQYTMGCHPSESSSYSRNDNSNWSLHGRRLLKPDEVIALNPRVAITFTPGVRPLCTCLVRYYEEKLCDARPSRCRRMARAIGTFSSSAAVLVLSLFFAGATTVIIDSILMPRR
ncbi:type IV secretory system conjugative DNA transfer family protein [Caulifigura coniformis]|nr:type IV secretory system conjugative DNA transfer family protein [Caulifigura coniformis]